MPSELALFSLALNECITKTLLRYRSSVRWNYVIQQFTAECTSCLFVWKFINLVLVAGIIIPSCIWLLFNSIYYPDKYNFLQLFSVSFELILASILLSMYFVMASDPHLVANSLNGIFALEHSFKRTFPTNQWRNPSFRRELNQFDLIGIILFLVVIYFAVASPILGIVALYNCLDAPAFVIDNFYPNDLRGRFGSIVVFIVRATVSVLAPVEGGTRFRTMALYSASFFDACAACLETLKRRPISFQSCTDWCALRILFVAGDEYLTKILTATLGGLFYFLLLSNVCSISGFGKIPWNVYIFMPSFAVITTMILAVAFHFLIKTSQESISVINAWKHSNGMVISQYKWKGRFFHRYLKSMRQCEFSYGSLGTVKRATRTDYIDSVIYNTVTGALAFQHKF